MYDWVLGWADTPYGMPALFLIAFAESESCRRKELLAYFGEDFPGDNCGLCDNCTTEAAPKEDFTL